MNRAGLLRCAPRRAAPRLTLPALPALHRYVAAEPELPYGMVTGRAALYRMAALEIITHAERDDSKAISIWDLAGNT